MTAPSRAKGQHVPTLKKKKKEKIPTATRIDDDTPRNFARLIQFQAGRRLPSGLDDGTSLPRKRKHGPPNSERGLKDGTSPPPQGQKQTLDNSEIAKSIDNSTQSEPQQSSYPVPTLLPGEKLSDFSARVDQALPLVGLQTKGPSTKGSKLTKHDRRLQRLQSQWRLEEQRRREKVEALLDEREDEKEEDDLLWYDVKSATARKKRRKGGEDEDPWASIAARRKGTMQINLQDVVQEPLKLGRFEARLKHPQVV